MHILNIYIKNHIVEIYNLTSKSKSKTGNSVSMAFFVVNLYIRSVLFSHSNAAVNIKK